MLRLLLLLAAVTLLTNGCTTDVDCNLNGQCISGACQCDPAWKGTTCDSLNLLPAQEVASYREPKTATWGANIVHNEADDTYHIWFAEMVNHCGLTSWLHNSQIVHAVAPSPNGPWTRKEVAVNVWSHNPIVVKAPDGTLVMFHIGDGTPSNIYNCDNPGNGSSPCGYIFSCNSNSGEVPQPKANSLHMSIATSFDGPWNSYVASISGPWSNNPAPYIYPNGTVLIIFNDAGMIMVRADSWKGPYSFYGSGACGGGEDPFLYLDSRGNFHCLYHRSPFSDPSIAIGHAFSPDEGKTWKVTPNSACGSTVEYEGGKIVVYGKRERPHLYFDKNQNPTHIVTGVCVNSVYEQCDRNMSPGYYDYSDRKSVV